MKNMEKVKFISLMDIENDEEEIIIIENIENDDFVEYTLILSLKPNTLFAIYEVNCKKIILRKKNYIYEKYIDKIFPKEIINLLKKDNYNEKILGYNLLKKYYLNQQI